jgi:hypothetical protein
VSFVWSVVVEVDASAAAAASVVDNRSAVDVDVDVLEVEEGVVATLSTGRNAIAPLPPATRRCCDAGGRIVRQEASCRVKSTREDINKQQQLDVVVDTEENIYLLFVVLRELL